MNNLNEAFRKNLLDRMGNQMVHSAESEDIEKWALMKTLNETIYLPFGSVANAEKFLAKNCKKNPDMPLFSSCRKTLVSANDLRAAIEFVKNTEAQKSEASPAPISFNTPPSYQKLFEIFSGLNKNVV